uniref:Uncharacterized protein n=1 Tax=Steinernema glaseri TaxID=37863 RepID=A0A1I7ZKJ9_9BILA
MTTTTFKMVLHRSTGWKDALIYRASLAPLEAQKTGDAPREDALGTPMFKRVTLTAKTSVRTKDRKNNRSSSEDNVRTGSTGQSLIVHMFLTNIQMKNVVECGVRLRFCRTSPYSGTGVRGLLCASLRSDRRSTNQALDSRHSKVHELCTIVWTRSDVRPVNALTEIVTEIMHKHFFL